MVLLAHQNIEKNVVNLQKFDYKKTNNLSKNSMNNYNMDKMSYFHKQEKNENESRNFKPRHSFSLEKKQNSNSESYFRYTSNFNLENKHKATNVMTRISWKYKNQNKFYTLKEYHSIDSTYFNIDLEFDAEKEVEVVVEFMIRYVYGWFDERIAESTMLKTSFKTENKNKNSLIENISFLDYCDIEQLYKFNFSASAFHQNNNFEKKIIRIEIDKNIKNNKLNNYVFNINNIDNFSTLGVERALIENLNLNGNSFLELNKNDLKINSYTYYNKDTKKVYEGISKNAKRGLIINPYFHGEIKPTLVLILKDGRKINITSSFVIDRPLLDVNNGKIKFLLEENETKIKNLDELNINKYSFLKKEDILKIISNNEISLSEIQKLGKPYEKN